MKFNIGYGFRLFMLALSLAAMFVFSGCGTVEKRLDELEGNPLYEIGKVGLHLTIREKSAELMIVYLDKNPKAVDRLPQLGLAWQHFWEGDNPFSRAGFDEWLGQQAEKLNATELEKQSLADAGELLWQYFEVDTGGYVNPSDRQRRIVDSFVAGLREGYRQWTSVNLPV